MKCKKLSPAEIKAEVERLRQKSIDLIARQPEKAARILSDWLTQPKNNKKAG